MGFRLVILNEDVNSLNVGDVVWLEPDTWERTKGANGHPHVVLDVDSDGDYVVSSMSTQNQKVGERFPFNKFVGTADGVLNRDGHVKTDQQGEIDKTDVDKKFGTLSGKFVDYLRSWFKKAQSMGRVQVLETKKPFKIIECGLKDSLTESVMEFFKPDMSYLVNAGKHNYNEMQKAISKLEESSDELTLYRGILANSMENAYKYIKSTKRYRGRDAGSGVNWTKDIRIAKAYGNYIFETAVSESRVKKVDDARNVVLLSYDLNARMSKSLVDSIDLGPNAETLFIEGNLLERMWNDKEFRDKIMVDIYGKKLEEDVNGPRVSSWDSICIKFVDGGKDYVYGHNMSDSEIRELIAEYERKTKYKNGWPIIKDYLNRGILFPFDSTPLSDEQKERNLAHLADIKNMLKSKGLKEKKELLKESIDRTLKEVKLMESDLNDREIDYTDYIDTHVAFVKKAYEDLFKDIPSNLSGGFFADDNNVDCIEARIEKHDGDKYNDERFEIYRKNHYPMDESEKEENLSTYNSDKGWIGHWKANPHHWEYWLSFFPKELDMVIRTYDYDGNYYEATLENQLKCAYIEMICDWFSFSYKGLKEKDNGTETPKSATGEPMSFKEWYKTAKKNIKIHPKMEDWFDKLLEYVQDKFEEVTEE